MDDILNDLIITDGKERPAQKKAVKKAAKKSVTTQQPVAVKPAPAKPKYSKEYLNTKGTSELKNICKKLGVPVSRRKTELIDNILNNS